MRITITIDEFQNLIRGAKLIDHNTPRMELEKHTWLQWRFGTTEENHAYAEYVAPVFRNSRNLGALRYEEIRSAGGIQ